MPTFVASAYKKIQKTPVRMVDMVPRGDDLKRGVVKGDEHEPLFYLYGPPNFIFVSTESWPRVMGATSSIRKFFVHPSS